MIGSRCVQWVAVNVVAVIMVSNASKGEATLQSTVRDVYCAFLRGLAGPTVRFASLETFVRPERESGSSSRKW